MRRLSLFALLMTLWISDGPLSQPTFAQNPDLRPRAAFRDCPECPEMVLVPAGSYFEGSPSSEPGRDTNEGPQRQVSIRQIMVGRFDVTRGEWAAFARAPKKRAAARNHCRTSSGRNGSWRAPGFAQDDNHPVVCVSWEDAQDYVAWLSTRLPGRHYRLLTEAEWEYAARAGTTTAYWWGDQASHEYANYGADGCCFGLATDRDRWINTSPVGSFPANPFGLYDMNGNVWEWAQDCFADSYADMRRPTCSQHVIRGGSWLYTPRQMRAAARRSHGTPGVSIGFRVAREVARSQAR